MRPWGRPHERKQGGRTDGDPQAGPRLPTEGAADRLQDGDQSWRFLGVCGDEFWETLREAAARAGAMAAGAFPRHQPDMDRTRAPGEVLQAALVGAMDRRCRHSTARAGCGRRGRRESEPPCLILNRNLREADPMDGRESFGYACPEFKGHHPCRAKEFYYFNADAQLVAVRIAKWKQVFCEQHAEGTLRI